jgi:hypothetical protein
MSLTVLAASEPCRKGGRPAVGKEVRDLIRRMSAANPLGGAPRIVEELSKIGIVLAKSTVEKYMIRPRRPPSPTWRAFFVEASSDPIRSVILDPWIE